MMHSPVIEQTDQASRVLMAPNTARAMMVAGEVALGGTVRLARTLEIVLAYKTAGLDWLFLDLEHGPHSIDGASQIAIGAAQASLTPIARVPAGEFGMAIRLLDSGALGIVMPHVDTAEQARQIVSELRFPPIGTRSVYGGMPQFGFAPHGIAETSVALNRETLIVAMLESSTAIENAYEIASVPGIDVLFIGANDLCAQMSLSAGFSDPRFSEAVKRTISACREHQKWSGIGGLYDISALRGFISAGMRFILAGSDVAFAIARAKEVVGQLRTGNQARREAVLT
jgi:4-hydroxy-2-oxoheptanedioate aldolase